MRARSGSIEKVLFAVACLVVIGAGGLQIYDRLARVRPPTTPTSSAARIEQIADVSIALALAAVRFRGNPTVALVEYSDFECPYCGRYARGPYARIQRDFVDTGQVAYAFFNFPLEGIHALALRAAESAECAGQQHKFWEVHDLLFRDQRALVEGYVLSQAGSLGLNASDFRKCLTGSTLPRIRAQVEAAKRSGVESTPTFIIGRLESGTVHATTRLRGAQPYEAIATALTTALATR